MAGFVPLVLSLPTVALAVVCLAGERYPGILKVFEVSLEDVLTSAAEVKVEVPGAQAGPKAGDMGLITRMFGWFALFGLLVFITGFYISTTVFALSFTRIQGGINWFGAVFITALALGLASSSRRRCPSTSLRASCSAPSSRRCSALPVRRTLPHLGRISEA